MHTARKIKENILSAAVLVAFLFVFGTAAYANVTASPTAVSFGNQTVGTASAPVEVILTNTNRGGIKIVNVSLSAAQFSYSGPSLPVTLNSGQSLTAYVTFQPSAAQAYSGALVLTRANDSTVSVSLSGTGVQTQATPLPPTITTQPASLTVTAGQPATFTVAATGTTPMTYQWKKNGTAVSGATSSTYTTPAPTTSDNGAQFTVVGANSVGSATSAAATLTVKASTVKASASYTLATKPSALSFSWQTGSAAPVAQTIKIIDNSPNCEPITITTDYSWLAASPGSGCTALLVSVSINTAGLAAGSYSGKIIITGPTESNSPFAVPVTLSVAGGAVAPSITTQPSSHTVNAGATATFTVAATGTAPITYQWNKNGSAVSGATSSSYTTPATTTSDNGAQFTVLVTNSAGSATSTAAILTVNAATATLTASSNSLSFGSIIMSSSSTQGVRLTNAGNSNVTISNVSISGAGFNASGVSTGLILTPGQAAALSVSFAPAATGSVTGSVTVTSNASPLTVALSGTGATQVTHSAALSWAADTSVVAGYNSYSSTVSGGPYVKLNATLIPTTAFSDTTVQSGKTYYYVVTAVDSSNVESTHSNETSVTIP